MLPRRLIVLALAGILTMSAAQTPSGAGSVGWYNGDWQTGIPGLSQWYLSKDNFTRVYDDFDVPAGGWTVVGVFSNVSMYDHAKVKDASWEIRSGVSEGDGGKLIASGVSRATQILDQSGVNKDGSLYRIQVDGLQVGLKPGRYWLSVAPVGAGSRKWYVDTTLGTNAVGTPAGNNAEAFFTTPQVPFEPTGSLGRVGKDFSQGVLVSGDDHIAATTPAPQIALPPRSDCEMFRLGKDYPAALNCFGKLREQSPSDFTLGVSFALMLEATGQSERARPVYEQVLKLQPGNLIALNNLAMFLASSGTDLDRALALAEEAKRQNPNIDDVVDTLGFIALKTKRTDEAIRIFRSLVEKHPEKVNWRYHLALALYEKGDYQQAKRELDICLAIIPGSDDEKDVRALLGKLPEAYRLTPPDVPPNFTRRDGEALFKRAQEALRGVSKDSAQAQKLLLAAVALGDGALQPNSLGYAYIYLGYIADRAERRNEALSWYTKASTVKDAAPVVLELANHATGKPLKWLRHLDDISAQSPANPGPPVKTLILGKGYVTTSAPPTGLKVATNLSAEERQENFDILWEAIDKTYADFTLKSIDWGEVRQRYQKRLGSVAGTTDFYSLLFQMVGELKDTHSWVQGFRPQRAAFGVGLSTDLFEGRPYVVAVKPGTEAAAEGITPGSEVLAVDGFSIEQRVEQLRPTLNGFSSQRALKRSACPNLLAGEDGSDLSVKLRSPDGDIRTLTLKRIVPFTSQSPARKLPIELTRQRFVQFGRHASGIGYIQIGSFNGREEIADEFDRALETLKDAPGLILDIRDNQGGFGNAQARIVGRFIQSRTPVAISYIKNGPGHDDLQRRESQFSPSGGWQYKRPVVLLVNDVTGSAADLFACYLRSTGRAVTIGSTTHGNLSGVAAHVVLPCGLIVRVSNGYVADSRNRAIEVNGNEPDIAVTPSASDFLQGRDPVLESAVASITRAIHLR